MSFYSPQPVQAICGVDGTFISLVNMEGVAINVLSTTPPINTNTSGGNPSTLASGSYGVTRFGSNTESDSSPVFLLPNHIVIPANTLHAGDMLDIYWEFSNTSPTGNYDPTTNVWVYSYPSAQGGPVFNINSGAGTVNRMGSGHVCYTMTGIAEQKFTNNIQISGDTGNGSINTAYDLSSRDLMINFQGQFPSVTPVNESMHLVYYKVIATFAK